MLGVTYHDDRINSVDDSELLISKTGNDQNQEMNTLLVFKSSIKTSYKTVPQANKRTRRGTGYMFQICVVVKNGRCIRRKRFGLWHAVRPLDSKTRK